MSVQVVDGAGPATLIYAEVMNQYEAALQDRRSTPEGRAHRRPETLQHQDAV